MDAATSTSEKNFRDRLTAYSLSELEDIFAYIDRETFPERHALVAAEIERRLKELDVAPHLATETLVVDTPPSFWRRVSSSFVDVSIQALVPFILYHLIGKALLPSGNAGGGPRGRRGGGGQGGILGDVVTLFNSVKGFFVGLANRNPEVFKQLELIAVWVLAYLVYRACWHVWSWTHSGSSPGMKELGLRLDRADGGRPSLRQAIVRFFLHYLLFVATLGVSGLWMLWEPQKRALHDKIAGTKLVRVRRSWEKTAAERQFD